MGLHEVDELEGDEECNGYKVHQSNEPNTQILYQR